MIKSIETNYKGYRFRSRTEARYAIFFDELGIKWEYELEGFKLPSGKRYLPDFYFIELNVWVEIKPSIDLINDGDFEKIIEFSQNSPTSILLIIGQPGNNMMFLIDRQDYIFCEEIAPCVLGNNYNQYIEENYIREGTPPPKNKADFAIDAFISDFSVVFGTIPTSNKIQILYHPGVSRDVKDYNFIERAYKKARSARFEFGERK